MQLYEHQQTLLNRALVEINQGKGVLVQTVTGGGKTVIMSDLIHNHLQNKEYRNYTLDKCNIVASMTILSFKNFKNLWEKLKSVNHTYLLVSKYGLLGVGFIKNVCFLCMLYYLVAV